MSRNKKKNGNRNIGGSGGTASSGGDFHEMRGASPLGRVALSTLWIWIAGISMIAVIGWAYWPTLRSMIQKWETQPDYSHGYLVLPIAVIFLWFRRSELRIEEIRPSMWGAALLLLAAALRALAGMYYLLPLDGWTLPLTVAGAVWLLFGSATLKWSLPSIVFLWFMIPLPYTVESWLSVPLQAVATKLSTIALVFLGLPAIAEGNVIRLGDHTLFVEEACSGLRIFVGIFALAFAFVLFSRWSWWQKGMVLLAALPVAIIANVVRIVATGLLYQWVSSEAGKTFSHDISGYVMIPFAALLLWLFLIYLDRLFPQVAEIRQPAHLYRGSAIT